MDSPQPSEAEIEQAIAAVLAAGPRSESRPVYERYQQTLLSDAAFRYIRAAAAAAKQRHDRVTAEGMEGLLETLIELRRYGFNEGWRRVFEDDAGVSAQALMELMSPRGSLDEKRRLLEEKQHILLDERAIASVRRIVREDQASGRVAEAQVIARYLRLLEDAKSLGIGPAWERFIGS